MIDLKEKKIARISTVPFFVSSQLNEQLTEIKKANANVFIITSPALEHEKEITFPKGIPLIEIEISRKIDVIKDIKALYKLYRCFKVHKFDIVHSTTPKAGLLTSIAGYLSGIPICLHTFTGQTWVEKRGFSRVLLKFLDRIIVKLNNCCYADSFSQKEFLVSEKICGKDDILVLGNGSLAGVNISRFDKSRFSDYEKNKLLSSLNIDKENIVYIFVGRVTKDKGILELIEAFNKLISNKVNATLLLVGPIDENLFIRGVALETYVESNPNIKLVGFTCQPEKYLSVSDVFCLPSYREGFGTVIIESAVMGLPSVASNIYGLSDAVQNDITGILVNTKNIDLLYNALSQLANDPDLRCRMGNNARDRALSVFCSKKVNELVISEYERLIGEYNEK